MELADGYELSELHASPVAPSGPARWQDIVQAAMDGAHEINRCGVAWATAACTTSWWTGCHTSLLSLTSPSAGL